MHSDDRKFDAEDKRLMGALGKVAPLAYQTLASIKFQIVEREKAEAALRELNETLEQRVQAETHERLQIWNMPMAATGPTAGFGR
jgi:benzoyl-CoA reductase/2-hydroxyglutaryl-CoA dehydratase subunit BcrC/BadD/HgdB